MAWMTSFAAYVRTILSGNAPHDRSGLERRGLLPAAPLNLTARAQTDLVAFLQALTGEIVPQVSSPPPFP